MVGEALEPTRDATGTPFVGSSGKVLDKALTFVGIDPKTAYVCNVVKCRRLRIECRKSSRLPRAFGIPVSPNSTRQTTRDPYAWTNSGRAILGPERWPGMVEMRGKWRRAFRSRRDAHVSPGVLVSCIVGASCVRGGLPSGGRAAWIGCAMTKDRAAADAIMERIRAKSENADVPTLERLAIAFKIVREGMAYAPQESPTTIVMLDPGQLQERAMNASQQTTLFSAIQ